MVADKAKKTKVEDEAPDHIDGELVLSIEKLQEIQDEIETVMTLQFVLLYFSLSSCFLVELLCCGHGFDTYIHSLCA